MAADNRTIIGSSVPAFRIVFFMWLVYTIEVYTQYNLGVLGIYPRTLFGFIGVFTAPLLHGNLWHLISNTVPVLFLGQLLFYFYKDLSSQVFLRCYFVTNLLVWLFGRPSIHIGASGLVYGLASFLIFYGLIRRDFKSLVISLAVMIVYGGIFYGVLPIYTQISWESHLFGAMVGIWSAISLNAKKRGT